MCCTPLSLMDFVDRVGRHFSLVMQSGAFIQLILTLIGVASRFHNLAQELSSIVDELRPRILHLKAVILVCLCCSFISQYVTDCQ